MKTRLILLMFAIAIAGCKTSNIQFSRALVLHDYGAKTTREPANHAASANKWIFQSKDSVYQIMAIIPVVARYQQNKTVETIWTGGASPLNDTSLVKMHVPPKYLADSGNFVTYKLLIKATKAKDTSIKKDHPAKEAKTELYSSDRDVRTFYFDVMSDPISEPIYILDIYAWDKADLPIKSVIGNALQKKIDLNKLANKQAVIRSLYNYKNPTGDKTNTSISVIHTTYKIFVRIGDYLVFKQLVPVFGSRDNRSKFDLSE